MRIPEKRFRVYIKPNKKENSFEGYDKDKGAYIFNIKAAPKEGRANKELLKFLKENSIKAVIKSGFQSRIKVVEKL